MCQTQHTQGNYICDMEQADHVISSGLTCTSEVSQLSFGGKPDFALHVSVLSLQKASPSMSQWEMLRFKSKIMVNKHFFPKLHIISANHMAKKFKTFCSFNKNCKIIR